MYITDPTSGESKEEMKEGYDHEGWNRSALEQRSYLQGVLGNRKASISHLSVLCLQN